VNRGVRAAQAGKTRSHLVATARRAFGRAGYESVSVAALVAEAGVTKGALYHHFADKRALFEEVFAQEQRRLLVRVARATQGAVDARQQLVLGCVAYLAAVRRPGSRQIVLVDGPAVLGWQAWRAADDRVWLQQLAGAIARAQAAGQVEPGPADIYARMLAGAMTELALAGSAADPVDWLVALLEGLSPRPGRRSR
jgi:AcrR family transcriptional regulator